MSPNGDAFDRCDLFRRMAEGDYRLPEDALAAGDAGGATRYGVTQKLLDSLRAKDEAAGTSRWAQLPDSVLMLRPDIARDIAYSVFWCATGVRLFWPLSPALALIAYDGVFQHGPDDIVPPIQREIGAKPDGVIGPATLQAAGRYGPYRAALWLLWHRDDVIDAYAHASRLHIGDVPGLRSRLRRLSFASFALEAELRRWNLLAPIPGESIGE